MDRTSHSTIACYLHMAKSCSTSQKQPFPTQPRLAPLSTPPDDRIRRSNRNHLNAPLDKDQFEDATSNSPNGMIDRERIYNSTHLDVRSNPNCSFRPIASTPPVVVSPDPTGRPPIDRLSALVAVAAHDLERRNMNGHLPLMNDQLPPVNDELPAVNDHVQPEKRDVLLGRGGHTKNPGNAAVTGFCRPLHTKYKELKSDKEKREFVTRTFEMFKKQGRRFWVKAGNKWTLATDSRAKVYFQRKLREGSNVSASTPSEA